MSWKVLSGALMTAFSVAPFAADSALAQRVIAGGGGVHVRAPFVRVDVYPYGGVSVRAPFAAVDVPPRGYYYGPPALAERRVVEYSFPTPQELAAMSDEVLMQALRSNAERLHARLARFNTGATWQRYLRLPDEALGNFSASPDERRNALLKLLEKFDYVLSQPQYGMIAELPAFAATQAAVSEAISRLDETSAPSAAPQEELPLPPPAKPG